MREVLSTLKTPSHSSTGRKREMNKRPIDIMLDQVEYRKLPEPTIIPDIPYATHEGVLTLGEGVTFKVYQLNDNRRVIDAEDVHKFFGLLDSQ
jgi:hypothetical protein